MHSLALAENASPFSFSHPSLIAICSESWYLTYLQIDLCLEKLEKLLAQVRLFLWQSLLPQIEVEN